jgi:hypothetical protein
VGGAGTLAAFEKEPTVASERSENVLLRQALDRLAAWMAPGTANEGIELQVGRVSCNWVSGDPSFISGGGDATFTASGHRGVITQNGDAYATDAGGTTVLTYAVTVDLNHAKTSITWTVPGQAQQQAALSLEPHRNHLTADAQSIVLTDDGSTDDAAYVLSFILL